MLLLHEIMYDYTLIYSLILQIIIIITSCFKPQKSIIFEFSFKFIFCLFVQYSQKELNWSLKKKIIVTEY